MRKRKRREEYRVKLDTFIAALSIDAWERHYGGPERGRRAWEAMRDRLQTNPGTAPAPLWAYESDVPDYLRPLAHLGADPDLRDAGREWLELRT